MTKWRTDGVKVVRASTLDMAMRGPGGTGRATAFDRLRFRRRRQRQNLDRHRHQSAGAQHRSASPWPPRGGDLYRPWPWPDPLGRAPGIRRRSQRGRLRLFPAFRSASGGEPVAHRPLRLRGGAQRQRTHRRQTRYRAGGPAGDGVLTPEPLRTSPHMTKRGFSANHKMRIYSGVADYGRCGPYHCPCRLPARHPT